MASLMGIPIARIVISVVCGMAVGAAVPLAVPDMRKGLTPLPDPYTKNQLYQI